MYGLQVSYSHQPVFYQQPDYNGWPESGGSGGFETGGFGGGSDGGLAPGAPVGWAEETKTSALLQEFEDVLTRALTPPDSPESSGEVVVGISPAHQPFYHPTLLHLQPPPPTAQHQIESNTLQPQDVSSETEIDAIVAESFNNADYGSSSDSGYEDPDWAPSSNKSRSRPYPSLEERKARKKEQNKNAATRYRQKKKQEVEVILSEEKDLQDRNETLKAEVDEIQREMKYLKSLLRHMFKAKGMIQ